jgi:hypothetical protein
MEGIDLIRLRLVPKFAKEHRATQLVRLLLPCLDIEPDTKESRPERCEGGVTCRADCSELT